MTSRVPSRVLPISGLALILLQLHCLLIPDTRESGTRVGNLPPSVRITAGAASPDPRGVDYKVQFQWSGSDADGAIIGYRWAVDDTLGERAWHETTGFSAAPLVSATTPRPENPMTLGDWHTFYVRALDNEYALSPIAKRYFNATTLAPATTILEPETMSGAAILPETFAITWEGEDLDSFRPDRKPLYYEFKLVQMADSDTLDAWRDRIQEGYNILLDTLRVGDKTRWIRVPESIRSTELRNLSATGGDVASYAFAVRSVDEAGAIEPVLDLGRNVIVFAVSSSLPGLRATISEPSLGSAVFPRLNNVWDDVTVFTGRSYQFHWNVGTSPRGSDMVEVNYGLDVDPEDYGRQDSCGIGGWSGWKKWQGNRCPFVFTADQAGSIHYLHVHFRNPSGTAESTLRCRVRLLVVAFAFSNFALLVDDAAPAYIPGPQPDADHDRFLNTTVFRHLYSYGHVDRWSAFGDGDVLQSPRGLPAEVLVSYQNIIWSLSYSSRPRSGIFATEAGGNPGLSGFLAAGGRLFVCGGPVFGALEQQINQYPHNPPAPEGSGGEADRSERDKLWYNMLYMRNTIHSYSDADPGGVCNQQLNGVFMAKSARPDYPDLFLDQRKWSPDSLIAGRFRGGIREWEGFKLTPSGGARDSPVSLPGLDTLYTAVTGGPFRGPCRDTFGTGNGSVIGWRYLSTRADTLAHRQHGRVIVFDFQPYFFTRDRLTDAGTSAINWLVTGRDR